MVIYQSIPVVETSSDNRLSWLSSSIHSLPFLFFKKKNILVPGLLLNLAIACWLAEQPCVLQVVPSQTYHLHGPESGTHQGTTRTMGLM